MPLPTKTGRILIIDDEPVIREVLERALSRRYDTQTVPSAQELQRALDPFRPDLILLDVHMPHEDGWQVCDRLRREKAFDDIPIIFLSAKSDEFSVRKGFSAGGDYYLPKPIDIEDLLTVVEAFIGRKHRYPDGL